MNRRILSLVRWTENPITEVCTNPAIYTAFEETAQAKATSRFCHFTRRKGGGRSPLS